jgi:hypothetical protein
MHRSIGLAVFVAVTVVVVGQSPSRIHGSNPAHMRTEVHASLRHDLSAPVSSLAPVPDRKPPAPDGDSGGSGDSDGLPGRLPTTRLASTDPSLQSSAGTGTDLVRGVSFKGIGDDGYIPPDPNGAVGPSDYVQVVNDEFKVFDKQGGTLLGAKSVSVLWNGFGGICENDGQGDPVALYDPIADRFLMTQFAFRYGGAPDYAPVGPYYECIAVTRTGDPRGAWYRYAFVISQTKMDDYPKLGVWPDGYYMTVNQFLSNGSWGGVGVVAFDRSSMLAGRPASMVYLDTPDSRSSAMLPADVEGWTTPPTGSPEYLLSLDSSNWGTGLDLYLFHVDWSNPSSSTFSGPSAIPTSSYDTNLCNYNRDCIPQPGGAPGVDANSYRLMYPLAYRNFGDHQSLVVNQTVDANGRDKAGVRWYEIRDPGGKPFVYQQGTYSPDGDNRFNGSAGMDQSGDIGLGYSVSSTSTHPSIRYTGRLASDPLGQLTQAERSIVAGTGSQPSLYRWGDYSSMSVDPADDCTFWYTNEYYTFGSGDWSTRIGSFRFPQCGPRGPTLSIDDVKAPEGQTATFTVRLSPSSGQTVSVDYATQPGTAGDEDFQPASGTLTFAPGQTTQLVSVPVARDSDGSEGKETFSLVLSNPVNAPIGKVRGTATIPGAGSGAVRPDGMIRLPGTSYRGKNIFNLTGFRQTRMARLRRGHTRRFFIEIRNTGRVPTRYGVRGPRSSPRFAVLYRFDHRVVTGKVEAGRFAVVVPAGGVRVLQLRVTVRRWAPAGVKRGFLVLARSTTGHVFRDAVKARVRVRRSR